VTRAKAAFVQPSPRWKTAQVGGVAFTAALVVALVAWPSVTLTLFWGLVIPLVPASLLFAPHVWRSVCPLATLNMLGNGFVARHIPSRRVATLGTTAGILLLFAMVPARRFAFNTDGAVLAATIAAVGLLAIVLGMFFEAKSGFCNSLCPVLPVEKLYGQLPAIELGHTRCEDCHSCSKAGCIDVAPTKETVRLTRLPRRNAWLFTTSGAFAAAFPGFVLGYFSTADVSLNGAPLVYATVLAWAAGSYALVFVAARVVRFGAGVWLPLLAGLAAGAYYWFVSPIVAATIGAPELVAFFIRVVFLALVGSWSVRALRAP
jgi:nitrite reductase (NADH) large subunit